VVGFQPRVRTSRDGRCATSSTTELRANQPLTAAVAWQTSPVTAAAADSFGARLDRFAEEWGLEARVGIFVLVFALDLVLDHTWWLIVSRVLLALLGIPLAVRVVRSFRDGYRGRR